MCPLYDGTVDAEHFLLLCPTFDAQRRDLLAGIFDILHPYEHSNLSNKVPSPLLLYGDEKFSYNLNRTISTLLYSSYAKLVGLSKVVSNERCLPRNQTIPRPFLFVSFRL